jgi:spore coat protein A, manganese oxidase
MKLNVKHIQKFVDELPKMPVLKPKEKNNYVTYYEVRMVEFLASLHRDLPETLVWGYEYNYPGPTIEVNSGERVQIKWMNHLPNRHLLPIDHTIHGARRAVPDVRTVVHVHGGNTEPESDGYPEAWFTNNFKETGPYFRKKVYEYTNHMESTALWYHDHALGITRLNVYAGLAGFYVIRSKKEEGLKLPSGDYEIPLLIEDKTVNVDGSLYYPSQPANPVLSLPVSVVPEFAGDMNVVNGKIWPYLSVEPRKYRFRILNASNTRFYHIFLDSGQLLYQIGTDGGFMNKTIGVRRILLAPAERVDVIVDFANMGGRQVIMSNDAPVPYPNGIKPNPETVGIIMQFKVKKHVSYIDTSCIPKHPGHIEKLTPETGMKKRFLTLDESRDIYGRPILLLDQKRWSHPVTECPHWGTTEVWYLINTTDDTHPIHIHLAFFQVVDRRAFDLDHFQKTGEIYYTGSSIPPEPQEKGWKDTVNAHPQQVTRIIKQFYTYTGLYVWHCHILEHEDYEMMRPFFIVK